MKKLQAELLKKLKKIKKTLKKIKKARFWLISKLILGGFFGLIILTLVAFHLAYRGMIYPGVAVAGFPMGNLTPAKAISLLEFKLADFPLPKLILSHNSQTWEIEPDSLELTYDAAATVQNAYSIGRKDDLLSNLRDKSQAWFFGIDLNWQYQFEQVLLENQIATIAGEVFIPSLDPRIEIVDQVVKIEPGKEGQRLDQEKLLSIVKDRLARLDLGPIKLPVIKAAPVPNENQIEQTRQRAEKFVGEKLILIFKESRWELEGGELVNFLSFDHGFDQEKIASRAAALAVDINRLPQNATFQFEAGKVSQFRPAQEGQVLDEKETQKLLQAGLEEIEKNPPVNSEKRERTIQLPVFITPPEITIDQVNGLGIKEFIGRGISYFWGSIPSRVHNITLASSNLNGILIPPGEIFSFNQTLGEVSPATGYQSAFIIKEGRTILGDGGGVCQVSTTLFRAALNAGLPIHERYPHSYRVSYYEQGGFGPGLDATVWMPGVDLKFKNDTPSHILIQANVDSKTKTLTFDLYGTSDGRHVSLSKPRVWDQVPPPPDLYQDDPTLPMGTIKQIERANWGAKAAVDWKVSRGEEALQERTFYSTYQPWQAVYLKGVGPAQ